MSSFILFRLFCKGIDVDQFIFPRTDPQCGSGLNRMDAVTGFNPFDQIFFPWIFALIDQINAGLIQCDRIQRGQDTDVSDLRIFRFRAAVAVNRHVAHYVDEDNVFFLIVENGFRGVGHGFQELIMIG